MTAQEQQIAANLFFDALCDLMDILQVPEQVISLNGTLSLAFGKGGQKQSSAHYDAATRTLALAKNAGGGALAHEWFHGFDHYICDKAFQKVSRFAFASQHWLEDASLYQHPLNQALSDCFRTIFLSEDHQDPSDYMLRSALADKSLGMFYFSQPQEVAARAFEACIQDNPIKNAFLVQGTRQSQEAKLGIYPQGEQRAQIAGAFVRYFQLLGYALDNHPGD